MNLSHRVTTKHKCYYSHWGGGGGKFYPQFRIGLQECLKPKKVKLIFNHITVANPEVSNQCMLFSNWTVLDCLI